MTRVLPVLLAFALALPAHAELTLTHVHGFAYSADGFRQDMEADRRAREGAMRCRVAVLCLPPVPGRIG